MPARPASIATLLTRDLNRQAPGIDPRHIVDRARVAQSARILGESELAVREQYERIVREHGFPLRLEWALGRSVHR